MNVSTQYCGMALLLVILFFYTKQRKVNLHTEKAFFRALLAAICCLFFDIASIMAIQYSSLYPDWIVHFFCKTYLASLVAVTFCSLLYVCSDICYALNTFHKVIRTYSMASLFCIIAVYIFPIDYFYDSTTGVLYSFGPSTMATYAFCCFFMFSTLGIIIRRKEHINKRRREAVALWILFWLFAASIQFVRNDLLLVGYACSLGIMVVYLMLENPGSYLAKSTGLFNQSALLEYLKQEYNQNSPFSMQVIVLDHDFDKLNDNSINDSVLMVIAQYLSKLPGVLPFQYSEDEIVLLFERNTNTAASLEDLKNRSEFGWEVNSTLVVPNWIYVDDCRIAKDSSDLLYLLHFARNHATELTDNNILYLDKHVIDKMQQEKKIEKILLDAIKKNRVEVYYQPIYSAKKKRFISAEALVRIRDEEGKLIPPGLFIPLAEKNGKIIQLGEIIFNQVCQFICNNDLKHYGLEYIEINLSTIQCAYDHLAADYIRIMNEYNIEPKMINLEITESASLKEKEILLDNMSLLMNYGISFSLDDFGTGQSNLNYIIDMPVNIVKFDREMSNAYFNNGKAKYVMDAAIQMIHGMKLEIVSEGIETAEQYEAMENLGINYIQGYYFSKPLPQNEFLEFVQKQNQVA